MTFVEDRKPVADFDMDRVGGLVAIARNASIYDWLLIATRQRRRPQPLPPQLRADVGLPPRPEDRRWPV